MATMAKLPLKDSLDGYSLYGDFVDEDSMNTLSKSSGSSNRKGYNIVNLFVSTYQQDTAETYNLLLCKYETISHV